MPPILYAVRGDDTPITINVKDEDDNPVDITGFTFFLTIKPDYDDDETDSEAVVSKTWSSHTDPENGETDTTFKVETSGRFVFDIQMVEGGTITTVTVNELVVSEDVTRRTS